MALTATESAAGATVAGILGRFGQLLFGNPIGAGLVSAIFPTQTAGPADTQLNSDAYLDFDIKEFEQIQTAAISQARTANGGIVLYHGTNVKSGVALLNGAPLEIAKAIELQHESRADLGFYLATSPFTAEHFAAVQAGLKGDDGTILSYMLTNRALSGLSASGAYFRSIQGNNSYTPGYEYYIPPSAFETFNALRASNQIQVFPAE